MRLDIQQIGAMYSITPVIATRQTIGSPAAIVLAIVASAAIIASVITLMMPFVKWLLEHEP